jgi:hypothetical protein
MFVFLAFIAGVGLATSMLLGEYVLLATTCRPALHKRSTASAKNACE